MKTGRGFPVSGAPALALAVLAISFISPAGRASLSAQAAPAAPAQAAAAPSGEPTPRWPDGHPNLGSVPGKTGYWEVRPGLGGFPRAADVPFQPWAKAVYDYRSSRVDLYPPLVNCKPTAGQSFFNAPGFEIVEVPELKTIFILDIAGPHSWRAIYMDGRPHPTGDDLRPTYLGHSIGHWEGDTLVIDSVGFNEKQWAGGGGFPSTDKLHLIEKISRPNLTTLSYEVTIDDPGAYTKPWSGKWTITEKTASKWIPGGEMFEYICQDSRYGTE
jgi:hypothetical protein